MTDFSKTHPVKREDPEHILLKRLNRCANSKEVIVLLTDILVEHGYYTFASTALAKLLAFNTVKQMEQIEHDGS